MGKKLRNKKPAKIDRHLAESLIGEPKAKKPTPNFYHRVYAIVEQIPVGKVTTYGAIAEVLGMSKAGAGSRYLRAIKRLKDILSRVPGFADW